jgi:menaquinone-dependent protoporphyrinogen oxidase
MSWSTPSPSDSIRVTVHGAMSTVHVITATRHGSTAEIGDAIAGRLRDRGLEAVTEDAEHAVLAPGEPVVLGSPIYMGKWLKPARRIAEQLAAEPPGRPVWVFTVGPLGDPPMPEDAEPEERIASFAAERARSRPIFRGKLDRSLLSRHERLAVRAVKAPDGDFREWDAIEAWADEIALSLGAVMARG